MGEETKTGAWQGYGEDQMSVEHWVRSRFGDEAFENADDLTLRLVEAVIELHQTQSHLSLDTTRMRLHKLVDTLMDSAPAGPPSTLIGSVQVALLAYAAAVDVRLDTLAANEIDRLYKVPSEAFRAKKRLRADQGLSTVVLK